MRCMFFGLEGRGLSMSQIEEVSGGFKIPTNELEPGIIGIMFEDNQVTNVNMPAFLNYKTEQITLPLAFECEHGMLDIGKFSECLDKVRIEDLTGDKKKPVIIPSENGTFWIDFEDKQ